MSCSRRLKSTLGQTMATIDDHVTPKFHHLKYQGIKYFCHAKHALSMATRLIGNSCRLIVHAVYPDVYTDDVTCDIRKMLVEHDEFLKSQILKKPE